MLDNNVAQYSKTYKLTFIALALYMFTSLGRVQALVPGFSEVPLGMISAALMIIAYVLEAPSCGGFGAFSTREEKLLVGLFIVAIFSIPGSVWPGNSFQIAFKKFLPIIVMFFILSFTTRSVIDIRKILWLYFTVIAILLVAAIRGNISHDSKILEMYDANDLSLALVCAIPLMVYFQKVCKGFFRLLLLCGILVSIITVISSASRGGFLGLLAIGGYLVLLSRRKITYFLMALIFLMATSVLTPPETWQRISTIWNPQTDYDLTAGDRTYVWKRAMITFANNPVLGVGIGNFPVSDGMSKEIPPDLSSIFLK